MTFPTIGSPDPMTDMARRVRDLERLVQEMAAARTLENATIRQGGLQIINDGSLKIIDSDGHTVAQIGALPSAYNRADGSSQPGLIFYREDGTTAAVLADANPLVPPYKQAWQVIDRAGHVVFADDTNSGQGVALPYLPLSTPMSNTPPTDTTTSATFTTLQTSAGYWMSPKIVGQILVRASDGSTVGEVRIVDFTGTQVGPTIPVTAGLFAFVNYGPVAVPGNFQDPIALSFQARRTAGTGTIGLNAATPTGVGS